MVEFFSGSHLRCKEKGIGGINGMALRGDTRLNSKHHLAKTAEGSAPADLVRAFRLAEVKSFHSVAYAESLKWTQEKTKGETSVCL